MRGGAGAFFFVAVFFRVMRALISDSFSSLLGLSAGTIFVGRRGEAEVRKRLRAGWDAVSRAWAPFRGKVMAVCLLAGGMRVGVQGREASLSSGEYDQSCPAACSVEASGSEPALPIWWPRMPILRCFVSSSGVSPA